MITNTYSGLDFSVAGPTVWNSLPDFIQDPSISADCLDICLKRICSLNTSALSTLEVLDDNSTIQIYLHTYLLYLKWPTSGLGLFVTLTFDPFTSKSNHFIFVPKCIKILNLVKFSKAVYKISCSQTFRIQAHTDGHRDNPKT